jgi:hypothetical protein
MRGDLRLLTWSVAVGGPLLIALVLGLYVMLFDLAARLPR